VTTKIFWSQWLDECRWCCLVVNQSPARAQANWSRGSYSEQRTDDTSAGQPHHNAAVSGQPLVVLGMNKSLRHWICCFQLLWYAVSKPQLLTSEMRQHVVSWELVMVGSSCRPSGVKMTDRLGYLRNNFQVYLWMVWQNDKIYRGADKSLDWPGRKQATVTADFGFHISYL